jgi:hypothetical protein
MLRSTGTGIGRFTASTERVEREMIFDNYAERAKALGRFPGTHSLGKEFETPKKEK